MSSNSSSQLTVNSGGAEIEELRALYAERKEAIKARLADFRKVMQWDEPEVFAELAFCLLTPQSSAKVCWDAVTRLKQQSLLMKGDASAFEPHLSQVRFGDSKARYIVEARKMFTRDGRLQLKEQLSSFYNLFELRKWLVDNVKGLGYKEASHFLRNIGLGEEFAILDRHILRNLNRLGVIPEIPGSITKKRYLEMEEKLRRFAGEIGIPMADLDLLFWSKETGWIFK
jgi:N-glycosylase/DNA lyase